VLSGQGETQHLTMRGQVRVVRSSKRQRSAGIQTQSIGFGMADNDLTRWEAHHSEVGWHVTDARA